MKSKPLVFAAFGLAAVAVLAVALFHVEFAEAQTVDEIKAVLTRAADDDPRAFVDGLTEAVRNSPSFANGAERLAFVRLLMDNVPSLKNVTGAEDMATQELIRRAHSFLSNSDIADPEAALAALKPFLVPADSEGGGEVP